MTWKRIIESPSDDASPESVEAALRALDGVSGYAAGVTCRPGGVEYRCSARIASAFLDVHQRRSRQRLTGRGAATRNRRSTKFHGCDCCADGEIR